MLVALANRISETWIVLQPFLLAHYLFSDYYAVQTMKTFDLSRFIEKNFFAEKVTDL